jgi:hypothetical protein
MLDNCDEAVVLADDYPGDLKQFVGAARRADGFGESREAGIIRIKGNVKKRADVRALLAGWESTLARTAKTVAVLTTGAGLRAAELTTRGRPAKNLAAWAAGLKRADFARGTRRSHNGVGGRLLAGASRFTKSTTVSESSRTCTRPLTARPIIATGFPGTTAGVSGGIGFILGPLGAEAEALEWGQIDLVEIFGRFIV